MDHNIAIEEPQQLADTAFTDAIRRCARLAWVTKDYEAADVMCGYLIEAHYKDVDAHNMAGRVSLLSGNLDEAVNRFSESFVIRQDPTTAINLAVAYARLKDFDQALMYCAEAIVLDAAFLPAYIQQAAIYQERGQFDDAEAVVRRALELHPGNDELLYALSLFELRRWCTPGSTEGTDGWKHYEHRPPRLDLAAKLDEYEEWTGQPLTGKTILVCGEQGIGDQIMFSCYLPLLAELGGKIVLFTRPELARLFACSFPGVQVIASDGELASIEADYWVAMGSLGNYWKVNIIRSLQSLSVDASRFAELLGPKTGKLRVGLCWRGNPSHRYDEYRSMTWAEMAPIITSSGNCEFYSLQQHDKESGLPCLIDYCHDVADTTAAIAHMDLVVSVDTAVLHLAGAMGKDTIAVLSGPTEWRWGAGETNRWYPSVQTARRYKSFEKIAIDSKSSEPSTAGQINCRTTEAVRECRYGKMHYYANDHYIGRALEIYGEYSQSEADLLRKVLKPGDVVIEAGANVGGLTVALADIVGPEGFVYAYEPQPEYHAMLAKNVNGRPRVFPIDLALGERQTREHIDLRPIPLDVTHAPGWPITGPTSVTCGLLSIDYFDFDRLHLIKIDVDGEEHNILKGAEKTIERCRPLLYVEYDKPAAYPDMIPWILARGYRIYQHMAPLFNPNNFAGNPVNVFGSLVSGMLLCVPQERKDIRPSAWGLNRVTAEKVSV